MSTPPDGSAKGLTPEISQLTFEEERPVVQCRPGIATIICVGEIYSTFVTVIYFWVGFQVSDSHGATRWRTVRDFT